MRVCCGYAGDVRRLIPVAAVLVLGLTWLFAVEAWRVRWPAMLIAFVAVGWPLTALAWRSALPSGWRWTLALAAGLFAFDLAVDWWFELPPERRLATFEWDGPRLGLLLLVSALPVPDRRALHHARTVMKAMSSAFAALLLGLVAFIGLSGPRDQSVRADAALVLGYALAADGTAQPSLVARIDHAAALYRQGLAPRFIASGGVARAGRTEGAVMRDLLIARGVPAEAITLDERARSTEENFACSAPMLLGARRVLVVTEPWHMPRALYQASRYMGDFDLLAAPASSPVWRDLRTRSQRLLSESVAYLFERVRRTTRDAAVCPAE
jgi:uncharacterized SAM-binding protein YcdF (DUF218 family)